MAKREEYDLTHHGDEVIISTDDKGEINMLVKIQTDKDEFRSVKLHFQTQTQVERLFAPIMKGIRRDNR